ncbi:hypothetical protein D3C71_1787410 [compost metagenome]
MQFGQLDHMETRRTLHRLRYRSDLQPRNHTADFRHQLRQWLQPGVTTTLGAGAILGILACQCSEFCRAGLSFSTQFLRLFTHAFKVLRIARPKEDLTDTVQCRGHPL